MSNTLYNILVPVDFTNKNKWAIAKAIELSNCFNCNIHLVYVTGNHRSLFSRDANIETSLKKLEVIKGLYKNQLCGEGKLEISVLNGSIKMQLAKYIEQYQMDLVITGLSKFNFIQRIISSVSISRLAKKTNIPVLAIRSGGLVCHFKKIVLPVSGEVPFRQIRLAALLGRAFKSTVYFVSLRKHADASTQGILENALEMVQSISTIPVQCFLLEGQNLAKSTLEFSKKINADLIMVNPIKDFCLPGLWNNLTNKLLSYGSKIPVVTIASNNNQV
ncbi:MAG: universal stress protein [Chitinophagaceae bacterium]